eukprot:TRINITY_DN32845_c0_g2_i7.p2 TRINITY_DN32845_c0_g2~~TRINITY_DN32845_c0_g2_i7.p2  ORF type:complete len:113 (-),score=2.70 TRINITY_DN32845_c0_g2_i7:572-910(-)
MNYQIINQKYYIDGQSGALTCVILLIQELQTLQIILQRSRNTIKYTIPYFFPKMVPLYIWQSFNEKILMALLEIELSPFKIMFNFKNLIFFSGYHGLYIGLLQVFIFFNNYN